MLVWPYLTQQVPEVAHNWHFPTWRARCYCSCNYCCWQTAGSTPMSDSLWMQPLVFFLINTNYSLRNQLDSVTPSALSLPATVTNSILTSSTTFGFPPPPAALRTAQLQWWAVCCPPRGSSVMPSLEEKWSKEVYLQSQTQELIWPDTILQGESSSSTWPAIYPFHFSQFELTPSMTSQIDLNKHTDGTTKINRWGWRFNSVLFQPSRQIKMVALCIHQPGQPGQRPYYLWHCWYCSDISSTPLV